jgi:CelD/BcsL family acetyltransferase involved in cellulose biosynthesis
VTELRAIQRSGQPSPATGMDKAGALSATELGIEVVSDVAGIRALKSDYDYLYRVSGNDLPFALQEWHLTWCEHFLNQSGLIHDQPLFCVLRLASGECVAIVPLIMTRRRLGPIRLATVSLIGSDPGLTEIRTPIIKPGYERLVVRAVHARLAQIPDWDWIQWNGVNGPLAEALAGEIAPQWSKVSNDYLLDLPATWQEFRAGMKRNARESMRHCYNSLKRDGHAFELVVARTPQEVRPALERFLELHAMRASMPWGAKHPNLFSGHAQQEFLYSVGAALAARDVMRVFQLRIGTQIVAARIGFLVGDSVYLYYSGFDPVWARYSVMTTTVIEAFKYAIAGGVKTINLSLTGEQSKLRWRPRLVEFRTAIVRRPLLSSRIKCGAYQAATSGDNAPLRVLRGLWAKRNWD